MGAEGAARRGDGELVGAAAAATDKAWGEREPAGVRREEEVCMGGLEKVSIIVGCGLL